MGYETVTDGRGRMRRFFGVVALALIGCGGDGAAGTCGKVQPCGGNIVGNWNIVADCISDAGATMAFAEELGMDCPTVTGHSVGFRESGSAAFRSDHGYAIDATVSGALEMNLPASCVAGATCAEVSAVFQANLAANPQPGINSVSCSGSGDCTCRFNVGPVRAFDTGTYVAIGSTLTLTSSMTGEITDATHCVQGNTAHLMTVQVPMNMGTMGMLLVIEDTVLVRQ